MIKIPPGRKVPLRDRLKANPPALATLATDVRDIPLGLIEPDPGQPRKGYDAEALDRLAATMKEPGQLQPIAVRKGEAGGFVIVAGERRWRAAKLAGLATITARIVADCDPLVYQLIENCCREDLGPMDRANAFHSLLQRAGWNQARIAEAVGVHRSTVSRALALLEMPTSLRGRVERGELSHCVATELDRHPDKALVAKLADDAVRWNWTVSQARTAARARGAPPAPDEIELPPGQPASAPIGDFMEAALGADFVATCNKNTMHAEPPAPPDPGIPAPPPRSPDRPEARAKRPAEVMPMVQGRLPLVYDWQDPETGLEFTIESREPITPERILDALRRLYRKVELEYLHPPKG